MPIISRSRCRYRWLISRKPMTGRRPIRRCSRNSKSSCRNSCRSAPRKPARISRSSRAAQRRRLPRSKLAFHATESKEAPQGASFRLPPSLKRSVQRRVARSVTAGAVFDKNLSHLRMPDGLARGIRQQVLLGDISDVLALGILREQMIERLVLARPNFLGDRQPPLLSVVEFGIDVENHAPERIDPVLDDLPDLKFRGPRLHHTSE